MPAVVLTFCVQHLECSALLQVVLEPGSLQECTKVLPFNWLSLNVGGSILRNQDDEAVTLLRIPRGFRLWANSKYPFG